MREVGIRELKRDASAIVDAVEAGETIVITRRGTPVARMGPVAVPASAIAEVEARAGLARARRGRRLTSRREREAWARFEGIWRALRFSMWTARCW